MNDIPVLTGSAGRFDTRRWTVVVGLVAVFSLLLLAAALSVPPRASAAEAPVGLGTARTYSVLGGQTVTNTGPSVLAGDVGVNPGTAITGFPPGVTAGVVHAGDTEAAGAQSDLTIAYNDAAGRAPIASIAGDLGGLTVNPGVYNASSSIGLTGTLTLDAKGDPAAVFIFQIGSALTTASASDVSMINGAQPCNVFWQIGSSATLGTGSNFVGTILALTSISVTTGTTVEGRALARNGQVSLDTNVFTEPGCDTTPTTTTTTTTTGETTTTTTPVTTTTDETTTTTGETTTTTDETTTTTGETTTTTTPVSTTTDETTTTTGEATTTTGPGTGGTGPGSGTGAGPGTGPAPGDDYPSGPDQLASTGAIPKLPALLATGAALLIVGGLLAAVARRRKAIRTPPDIT
jgi:Ice-binding-like